MPIISEKDLAVFISLLSGKIAAMKWKLREPESILEDNVGDEQINDEYELQETIERYSRILDDVREEYEAGLVDGINLPSFEALTATNGPEYRRE